jgi:hypothetical protein
LAVFSSIDLCDNVADFTNMLAMKSEGTADFQLFLLGNLGTVNTLVEKKLFPRLRGQGTPLAPDL